LKMCVSFALMHACDGRWGKRGKGMV
jgi:hypothetical protein